MKSSILFVFVLVLSTVVVSCSNQNTEEPSIENTEVATNAEVALKIDGMTCIKGCVGAINAKMAKTEGVGSCDIDFEASKAVVTYDDEVISTEDIIAEIGTIADGAYKAEVWAEAELEEDGEQGDGDTEDLESNTADTEA